MNKVDKSNGYENIAELFIGTRGVAINGVGARYVRKWAKTLPENATVLDIGCGTGIPVSKILIDEGLTVYGIDASPTMVQTFRQNFPGVSIACEAAEESSFFNRQFDAVIAWGLMFLLPELTQVALIQRAANALRSGGIFLFTSPSQNITWHDAMSEQVSLSLGAKKYKALLAASGMSVTEEFEDEGENHYYHALKH